MVSGKAPRGTLPTLTAMIAPDVVHSFRVVSEAACSGGPVDPYDQAVVAVIHEARVWVAERWSRAGASPVERQLAARVDRVLAPFAIAVADHPDAWTISEWLGELWTRGVVRRGGPPCVGIDTHAWWGWQVIEDSAESQEAFDQAELEAVHRELFPARPDRHEVAHAGDVTAEEAWRTEPKNWHEVSRHRWEDDADIWDSLIDDDTRYHEARFGRMDARRAVAAGEMPAPVSKAKAWEIFDALAGRSLDW